MTASRVPKQQSPLTRGSHVGTRQMHVGLNPNGLAVGAVEVGRHATRHDEERVVADKHEGATGAEKTTRFWVEAAELRQVLVNK